MESTMRDMAYVEPGPLPNFKVSPMNYGPMDCGPGYFGLQVPPVNTDFAAFDFGYQGAPIPHQLPILSPGSSISPRTASRMSSMPTPPLIDSITTPTPLKVEASETSKPDIKLKPQGIKRKHSDTPPILEPTVTKPQSHLRTAKRVSQTNGATGARNSKTTRSSPDQLNSQSGPGCAVNEELDSEVKARAAHNQVEQQYRQRLNAHFERLLAVLPVGDGTDETGEMCGSGVEPDRRKVSKAEVLDLARRRIEVLEWEVRRLEREKREMMLGGSS